MSNSKTIIQKNTPDYQDISGQDISISDFHCTLSKHVLMLSSPDMFPIISHFATVTRDDYR